MDASPSSGKDPAKPRQPWHRQPNESTPAYQAFERYRDQLADRSTGRVARELGKGKRDIDGWSSKWRWVERVAAYDQHLSDLRLQQNEDAILQMSRRQAEAAQLQQFGLGLLGLELVRRVMEDPGLLRDLPLDVLVALAPRLPRPLFVAAEMERRARGLQATSQPHGEQDPVLAAALGDEAVRDALALVTRKAVAEAEKREA